MSLLTYDYTFFHFELECSLGLFFIKVNPDVWVYSSVFLLRNFYYILLQKY